MASASKVAEFIANRQLAMGMTNQEIADHVGYANANVISMMKKGRTKLPLEKVGVMADALGADPAKMMRMTLKEYAPELLDTIEKCLGGVVVTENEKALLEIWRDATNNADPAIPEDAIKGLHQGFVAIMSNAQVQ